MNCRRIEKLIPLYVEDDLEIDDASRVLAHAKGCEGCREMIAQYEASQLWLRSSKPPEFDDAVFDSLKRDVMLEIERGRQRSRFLDFFAVGAAHGRIFATSAAVLIIIVALAIYFKSINSNPASQAPDLAQETLAPLTSPRPEGLKTAPKANPGQIARRASAARFALAKHRKERPGLHQSDNVLAQDDRSGAAKITMSAGSMPERMTRIEFQTSDPNIRIIWLSPEATGSQSFDPLTETD